ncbi:MAG: hypothetical protein A2W25_13985 [candidate division Zixibacteria bacterium RBG_16_53_22]|nr:MAG: hypothetical protein A2W25_13985 [candidate division Zixibacteria bacterium RBG_16_53_22]
MSLYRAHSTQLTSAFKFIYCPHAGGIQPFFPIAGASKPRSLLNQSGKVRQDGYRNFLTERSKTVILKVNYIRQNPVRAGIVIDPADYPYSSARYSGLGLFIILKSLRAAEESFYRGWEAPAINLCFIVGLLLLCLKNSKDS